MKRTLTFAIILSLIMATALFSGVTGKISGQITDEQSGQPLGGVNVIIEGTSLGAASDMDGNYSILNIAPGTYTVKVMMIGYAPLTLTDVRVNIDLTTPLNAYLRVESLVGEEVVVVAERKVVQRDVASSQTNISKEQIDDLPVTSVTGVIGMQAGVDGLSVRKGDSDELAMMVDGISLKDDRTGKPISGIPLSSVQEIMITSGGFSAEYSDLQAGVINVVTREGSTEKYTFNLTARYSPPASKHFGLSVYDPNSYYVRPWLDEDVCWTGTNNGAWDDYTQASYPSFTGWNKKAQELLADSDPTNDLTPTAAKRLFEWEHRRQGDIKKGDYNIDFGFGGPVPIVSKMLGNLRFYTSFKTDRDMYLVPLTRDAFRDYSGIVKLTSDVTKKIKLQFNYFAKESRATSDSETGGPTYFEDGLWDFVSQTYPFGSASQQREKIFYPDYYCSTDISNRAYSLKMTHLMTKKTFYEGIVEYATTKYNTYPGDERDRTEVYDIIPGDGVYLVDEAPWGFETLLASKSIDGFMMGAKSNARDSTKTSRINVKWDLTSQVNINHQLKAGLQFDYYKYKMNYGGINPDLPTGRPWTKWERDPFQIGVYGMDKLEYEGWNATLGLRVEYFNPNCEWYDLETYDKLFFTSNYKAALADSIGLKKAKSLLTFLPRLGISHPITVNSKLYFNYGHMRQKFSPAQLFGVTRITGGQVSYFGNPELPMEKTIEYELGYDHALFDQYLFHAAAYYKDKSDQASSISYTSADNTVDYNQYANIYYQDVRGLEIELRKRVGSWLTGFINYTYAVYTSGSFGIRQRYENPSTQKEYELDVSTQAQYKPIPQPQAKFNMSFHTPMKFGPTVVRHHILGGWDMTFTGSWTAGSYVTYGNVTGVTYNVQWRDSKNIDMKIAKTFDFGPVDVTVLTEIFNIFNFKRLSLTSLGDLSLNTAAYTNYTESLHFPKKVYDELGEKHLSGHDKLGDYRSSDVKYQAMKYTYTTTNFDNADPDVIYYVDDQNKYMQLDENGVWQVVSSKRINKLLDDKAYIFNPCNESFMFFNPRDVFFGVRISYEL
ncbi:MAG: TonB-dependent receptor [Candidatus Marinimicrobia bacterium]|nr:TonB-dependent receptor [Candidatus Neomarinimicrobiota bacterium]